MNTNIVRKCATFLFFLLGGPSLALAAPDMEVGALNSATSASVPIKFVNDGTVVGLEFVVEYTPTEVTVGVPTVGAVLGLHTLVSRQVATGKLKIVVYPPANNPLIAGGEIAKLPLSKAGTALAGSDRLKITNVVMTKQTAVSTAPTRLTDGFMVDPANLTLDSDVDGIPDYAETVALLHPLDERDAAKDADGDGISNLVEYQQGTPILIANRAPTLVAIGNKTVNETALLSFSTTASDLDGTTPTVTASGLPSGATFVNKVFSWTPTYAQSGPIPSHSLPPTGH